MPSEFSCLTVNVEDSVAHIRLIKPDVHNRFDDALHSEFPRALAQVAQDQQPAALVISSEGKSFSAGGDLDAVLVANRSLEVRERLRREALSIVNEIVNMPIPVITAVQGAAIGLGASVVTCSDIIVAWKDAKIADPHVKLGLVAGDGGVLGWSQGMGVMRAKRYLLTGDTITGAEAHAMGLVSDIVENPEDALPAAMALARQIAALPRGGVRGTKRAFARISRDLYGAAFELSLAYEMETLAGEEVRETIERLAGAKHKTA